MYFTACVSYRNNILNMHPDIVKKTYSQPIMYDKYVETEWGQFGHA